MGARITTNKFEAKKNIVFKLFSRFKKYKRMWIEFNTSQLSIWLCLSKNISKKIQLLVCIVPWGVDLVLENQTLSNWHIAYDCNAGRRDDHRLYTLPLPFEAGNRYCPLNAKISPMLTSSFFILANWASSNLSNNGFAFKLEMTWFVHCIKSSNQTFCLTPRAHGIVVSLMFDSGSIFGPDAVADDCAFAFAALFFGCVSFWHFRFLLVLPWDWLHTTLPDMLVQRRFINCFLDTASNTHREAVSSSSSRGALVWEFKVT